MGYLSKEEYERKRAYAERKMKQNSLIESLTEDQHEALADLCRIRHEIHSNPKGFFNIESKVWDYIDYGDGGIINTILENAGLEPIEFNIDPVCYPSNFDYDDEDIWDGKYKDLDDALKEIYTVVEEINNKIEEYLRIIDEAHGTKYCPTGLSRIF